MIQCCAIIERPMWTRGVLPQFRPCRVPAKHDRDGRHYCTHHDPVRRAAIAEDKAKLRRSLSDADYGDGHGSIELDRRLCVEIKGPAHEDDSTGRDYGSVDIAEILSAEVLRLWAVIDEALARLRGQD